MKIEFSLSPDILIFSPDRNKLSYDASGALIDWKDTKALYTNKNISIRVREGKQFSMVDYQLKSVISHEGEEVRQGHASSK